jgi:hypothetical protein
MPTDTSLLVFMCLLWYVLEGTLPEAGLIFLVLTYVGPPPDCSVSTL